jgi:signal transduction histidine kinase/CheY-like chemotaxis protein/HPt (histidine-containing phosphotransfer) domain-containing protein
MPQSVKTQNGRGWLKFSENPSPLFRVLLFILILFPVVLLSLLSYDYTKDSITQTIYDRRGAIAEIASLAVKERLDHLLDVGTVMAHSVGFPELVREKRWEDALQLQLNAMERLPYIERILIVSSDGVLQSDIPETEIRGTNLSFRKWYHHVVEARQPVISNVFKRLATPRHNVVAAAIPMFGPKGDLDAIFLLQVNVENFVQWSRHSVAETLGSGFLYFVDSEGNAAAHPRFAAGPDVVNLREVPTVERVLRGETGVIENYNPIEKEWRLSAFAPVPEHRWGVIAQQPLSEALLPRDLALGKIAFYFGLVILAASVLAAWIVYNLGALARARQAADRATGLKTQFLANMSHEIRTPLNGVVGMTGILMDTPLNEEQKRYVKTIRSSSDILLSVINDILDVSRIEAGMLQIENAPFDLVEVIESTMDTFAERAEAKGLELMSQVDSAAPTALVGDSNRIRQILNNLVGNALKFTEKGEVLLRVAKVSEVDQARAIFRFEVRDTGPGLSREQQAELFRPFSQVDSSAARKHGGSGLGLSISKGIVERMGGRIGVDSNSGQGALFWFALPLGVQSLSSVQTRRAEHLKKSLQGVRVMVVDDNATNREILHHQLQSWHMLVEEAPDSRDVVVRIIRAERDDQPFRLVLMDMQLPDTDGTELARKIRQACHNADLKIIILSSISRSLKPNELMRAGVDMQLSKPVKSSQLYNAIQEILGGYISSPRLPEEQNIDMPLFPQLRILLVEDNPTNQEVVTQQLRKLGHQVDLAVDGRDALMKSGQMNYSLILMDCQMPEMDGYEATRKIREREAVAGLKPVPIVALTAHAMEGEREKCLAAGMNEFITKPIDQRLLRKKLAEILISDTEDRAVARSSSPSETIPMVDDPEFALAPALAALEGDRELLEEVMKSFLQHVPGQLEDLMSAGKRGDPELTANAAHKLKSSIGSLHKGAAFNLASKIEKQCRAGKMAGIPEQLARLEDELSGLISKIARQMQEEKPL